MMPSPASVINATPEGMVPALHIGLPRTGTKLLQWHLFAAHPQLYYLGIFDGNPNVRDSRRYSSWRDPYIEEMMQGIILGDLSKPDLGASRRLAQERVLPHLKQGRVPLLSLETLSHGTETVRRLRAENLWRIFGPCRVVLTLRHPVALVESAYRMILRRENIRLASGRAWYQSLDDWFHDQLEYEIFPYLDYARTYKLYSELFGPESVKVMLFEDLRADPQRFVRTVCEHLGIDPAAVGPWQQQHHENRRLSDRQLELIQRVAKSRIAETFARATTPGVRAWFLRPPRSATGHRSPGLSAANQRRIAAITAAGNRELVELTGLPLGSYGYPLDEP